MDCINITLSMSCALLIKKIMFIFSYDNILMHNLFGQFSLFAVNVEVQLGPHAFMAWG